jgi:TetR/AcrR family transcriptional regulator, acrAB operon repressor
MVRRPKHEALATRNAILDAAELLFQQHGVSRTSLHNIATSAGVTRGAVYWHFEDKADLFNAMMDRATLPLEQVFEAAPGPEAASADGDLLGALEARWAQVLRLMMQHAPTRRVFEIVTHKVEYVEELQAVRERHLLNRGQCLAQVEQDLALAAARGLIGSERPLRDVSLALHALMDGLIQNWLLDTDAFDLEQVGRGALRTYLQGLRARSVPSA